MHYLRVSVSWECGHGVSGSSASGALTGLQTGSPLTVGQSEDSCMCDVRPGREGEWAGGPATRSWKSPQRRRKHAGSRQCTLWRRRPDLAGSRDLGTSGRAVAKRWDESHVHTLAAGGSVPAGVWLVARFEQIRILSKACLLPSAQLSSGCLHWALPGLGHRALA